MSKRLNESSVWDHAKKIGGGKAQCNLCSKVILCSGGSTSGLKRHLQSVHSAATTASANATQPSLASFGISAGSASRPCTESRQEKITQLLSQVIIVNMLPLSLVDNAEFIELMACMEPNYKVPCRQTIHLFFTYCVHIINWSDNYSMSDSNCLIYKNERQLTTRKTIYLMKKKVNFTSSIKLL